MVICRLFIQLIANSKQHCEIACIWQDSLLWHTNVIYTRILDVWSRLTVCVQFVHGTLTLPSGDTIIYRWCYAYFTDIRVIETKIVERLHLQSHLKVITSKVVHVLYLNCTLKWHLKLLLLPVTFGTGDWTYSRIWQYTFNSLWPGDGLEGVMIWEVIMRICSRSWLSFNLATWAQVVMIKNDNSQSYVV